MYVQLKNSKSKKFSKAKKGNHRKQNYEFFNDLTKIVAQMRPLTHLEFYDNRPVRDQITYEDLQPGTDIVTIGDAYYTFESLRGMATFNPAMNTPLGHLDVIFDEYISPQLSRTRRAVIRNLLFPAIPHQHQPGEGVLMNNFFPGVPLLQQLPAQNNQDDLFVEDIE